MNCPRYQQCSAAICPLWKPINEQKMVKGERVCGILLEHQKLNSERLLITLYGPSMLKLMSQATKDIKDHGGYLLRSALKRAENSSSRLTLLPTQGYAYA
jgi:hypothetical protein